MLGPTGVMADVFGEWKAKNLDVLFTYIRYKPNKPETNMTVMA